MHLSGLCMAAVKRKMPFISKQSVFSPKVRNSHFCCLSVSPTVTTRGASCTLEITEEGKDSCRCLRSGPPYLGGLEIILRRAIG